MFGIEIAHLTKGHQDVGLYRCDESGFRFYYPADIVGDSGFYHQLQANEWYYMSSKWEFDESLKFVQPGSEVLEIGSAKGDFLQTALKKIQSIKCTGLELNTDAVGEAQARGLHVLNESSTQHAQNHVGYYDVVATFQVLEHIPDPVDVLRDALRMLKPNGVLLLGVPDNSARAAASIFLRQDSLLNMPPHHQGLWDIPSLSFLPKVLPVQLEYMVVEPAVFSHHSCAYRRLIKNDLIKRFGGVHGWATYIAGRQFYNHALGQLSRYLPAHSLLAVFRKRS
jgi:SAM-dependent methyltransferase